MFALSCSVCVCGCVYVRMCVCVCTQTWYVIGVGNHYKCPFIRQYHSCLLTLVPLLPSRGGDDCIMVLPGTHSTPSVRLYLANMKSLKPYAH